MAALDDAAPALDGRRPSSGDEPAAVHVTSAGWRLRGFPVGRIARAIGHRWRRSIQFRVVATTLLVSAAVVALLGLVVLQQVRAGLLQAKVRSSVNQELIGLASAQQSLTSSANAITALTNTVKSLSPPDTSRRQPGGYEVVAFQVLSPGVVAKNQPAADVDFRVSSIPDDLIAAVSQGQARYYYAYTVMQYTDGFQVPGLAIGSLVTTPSNQQYEIYYVFSLQQEQQTLELVTRTLLVSGLGLVALLAAIAYLVTRQVVKPVRVAAQIAERLADGRLQERMTPKGEDDLARLAASFNKMAESLQRQIRRLEHLSRVQRRFVSDVSHELRTPVTTIRMAADVLFEARHGFDPASARSAELLQNQLDRFESLLADLLEISRHDAGAASLEADVVDIRDLVRHVVEDTEPLAARRGSIVQVIVPAEACLCEADGRRVERILRNLLVNAVEHGEGRPIVVRVAAGEDAVAVAVRDHGIGLRPGEAALVFNRFWRADPARARSTGGTGLGLAIALEDARLHGGTLQAWGEPGKGSQFVLTLPKRVGFPISRPPIPVEPEDAAASPSGAGSASVAAERAVP